MCRGMASSFPDLDPRKILTQEGGSRVARVFHTHACVAAATTLFTGADLLKRVWVGGSEGVEWEDDGDEDDTFVMRWQIIILKEGGQREDRNGSRPPCTWSSVANIIH